MARKRKRITMAINAANAAKKNPKKTSKKTPRKSAIKKTGPRVTSGIGGKSVGGKRVGGKTVIIPPKPKKRRYRPGSKWISDCHIDRYINSL